MPGASARTALRQATGAVHERLHDVSAFARLADGRLTREDYGGLLRRLLGFHRAMEAALRAAPSVAGFGIDLGLRARSPMLIADLAALGVAPASARPALPPFRSAAGAMGAVYVVEGSTLGGQQLARGLAADWPKRFLLGHGSRNGAMWRECCEAIEACGAEAAARNDMIAGAEAAFGAFEAWFAQGDTQADTQGDGLVAKSPPSTRPSPPLGGRGGGFTPRRTPPA